MARYTSIALAYMPKYPVVERAEQQRIASLAADFIDRQLRLQPFYVAFPIRSLSLLLVALIAVFGPGATRLVGYLPGGGMIERFYRSLVSLRFFEDRHVLESLGQMDPDHRLDVFRARFTDRT